MKIIVCVKQISHTYTRTSMDPGENFVGSDDRVNRINPYDEAALMLALRAKESVDSVEIVLLTLGPIIAESELKRCLAMGVDDIYQIRADGEEDEGRLDPSSKAAFLARASRELEGDLVLCGKESLDSRNGLVGAFMAHRLQMPFVSAINDLVISEKNSVQVRRNALRGAREVLECCLPAVLSVDLGSRSPDYPAYREVRKAASLPIRRLRFEKEMVQPKTTIVKTFPPRPRPKCIPAPDSRLPAFDRVQQLLMGSRVEKKGTILRGSAESQAEGIMSFLEEHGFWDA